MMGENIFILVPGDYTEISENKIADENPKAVKGLGEKKYF